MDDLRNKDTARQEDFLPVEFLGKMLDNYETYKIMSEIFYEYIPKSTKMIALSEVAERIQFELKDKS